MRPVGPRWGRRGQPVLAVANANERQLRQTLGRTGVVHRVTVASMDEEMA